MNIRYRLIIVVFVSILVLWKTFQYYGIYTDQEKRLTRLAINNDDQIKDQIRVSVYYESLCSDSRNFFIKQLLPTYLELSSYISLDLIPYGKAKTIEDNGNIEFECQHRSTECLGNKIHACAIDQISNPLQALKFVSCSLEDGILPYEAAERCASENDLDYRKIVECADSKEASIMLKEYGKRTDAVQPPITFIPTIELNGAQTVPLPNILKDFKKVLCTTIKDVPEACM
ncbi:PREDICTED: GILT-like protein C02D5.2 [Nicrophorus vespilloides]|uniref:GILT-like protein C02D5.2 n=1 Tax=Nicrophorus vespilloides TaxID=110193 RepID=A0ABM1M7Q7_NICVS|nr:PREDICTED: GILT-like protein C02D5.2 [Nicrophorus vespilloides]